MGAPLRSRRRWARSHLRCTSRCRARRLSSTKRVDVAYLGWERQLSPSIARSFVPAVECVVMVALAATSGSLSTSGLGQALLIGYVSSEHLRTYGVFTFTNGSTVLEFEAPHGSWPLLVGKMMGTF